MKPRTLIFYWCIVPLLLAAYIVAMATASAKDKRGDARGPNAYASPNGNHWGFEHGKGKPIKTP